MHICNIEKEAMNLEEGLLRGFGGRKVKREMHYSIVSKFIKIIFIIKKMARDLTQGGVMAMLWPGVTVIVFCSGERGGEWT